MCLINKSNFVSFFSKNFKLIMEVNKSLDELVRGDKRHQQQYRGRARITGIGGRGAPLPGRGRGGMPL